MYWPFRTSEICMSMVNDIWVFCIILTEYVMCTDVLLLFLLVIINIHNVKIDWPANFNGFTLYLATANVLHMLLCNTHCYPLAVYSDHIDEWLFYYSDAWTAANGSWNFHFHARTAGCTWREIWKYKHIQIGHLTELHTVSIHTCTD